MTRGECEHSAKNVFTCVFKLHLRREHAAYGGYPHQSATLPASPKGSLYISRAFAILNIILLSSKLRTNKIGVDVEAITTKPSLEGRGTTIVVDECSRRSRRALCDSVTLKRT